MSDKVILFIDTIGRDDHTGGGSSQSLRLLLEDSIQSHPDRSCFYLINDFNKKYTEKYIDESIKRIYVKFPKLLNKYNHELTKFYNIILLFLYSLPLVNLRLLNQIKENKIDTIVFNESRAFLTFFPIAIYSRISKKIQTIKYVRGDFRKKSFLNKLTNVVATKIIVLASYLAVDYSKNNLSKTYVLSNGINVDSNLLDKPQDKNYLRNDNDKQCLTIINVGTITEYKGQLDLIKALVNIDEPIIKVKFIGNIHDDVYYEEIVNYINENGLYNRVFFEGYQENVVKYYQEADLMIHTSYNEGVPRVLLEAQLNKIFVIASDIPGNLELIKNGVTGLTYRVGNVQKLQECIQTYFKLSSNEKEIILDNGKNNVIENYNSKGIFNKFMKIVED